MDEDFFKDYPLHGDGTGDGMGGNERIILGDERANGNGHMEGEGGLFGEGTVEEEEEDEGGMEGGPPAEDAEPEAAAVTEWRAAFAKGLEEKVSQEREVKAERAERARETLRGMHERWEGKAGDMRERNVKMEREFLRERDGVISRMSKEGMKPSWDIVPELVDMSGKFKEGARDTSRMRQVLMRMKTN